MHGDIVPRRDDLFSLIPCWGYIRVRSGEDHQRRLPASLPPLRVGSCDVTDQGATRAGCPIEEQRQVAGEGKPIHLGHQQTKTMLLDKVVQLVEVGFDKRGRYVHGVPLTTWANGGFTHP